MRRCALFGGSWPAQRCSWKLRRTRADICLECVRRFADGMSETDKDMLIPALILAWEREFYSPTINDKYEMRKRYMDIRDMPSLRHSE